MIQQLPLTSLVGLDTAVQALLLLAVEPRLGGAVFAAPAGTGKSSLARGFAALGVREQGSGVRGQEHSSLTPHAHSTQHTAYSTQNSTLKIQHSPPFVELPLGADDEALLGGLDLEATLHSGQRVARGGLLARADGGVIYADQINLIADSAANQLLGALDSGEVRLERDGLSMRGPARFTLIGSYDPAEGQPRRHLLDRVGLWVALPAATDERVRAEVVRRNLGSGGLGLEASFLATNSRLGSSLPDDDLETLRDLVVEARVQLPAVTISDAQMTQLAAAALAFGVEGHRADMFAAYAACAAAALDMRATVEQADLELAVRLVILPRATQIPAEEPQEEPQNQEPQNQEPEQEPQNQEPQNQEQDQAEEPNEPPASSLQPRTEQVFAALMADLPAELAMPFKALRRGRTGSRGSVVGKRGRHIRSVPGDPRRARIDIPATLRAAAPMQRVRGQGSGLRGQTDQRRPTTNHDQNLGRSSVVGRRSSVTLRAEDIRTKQYKSKAGALFLFAVDASGSMALHRMRQAKGAVHALLQRAYVHRDRVALLAFRGEKADLLLPPSQSVELARRALDLLPTGGGTPIAAALLAALDVAAQARGRGIMQTVLVLLTDGRANIGLRGDRAAIGDELQALGRRVAEAGITALVVDTQRSYLSRGEARTLAGWLGGQYIYLPNAKGEQIAAMVGDAVRE